LDLGRILGIEKKVDGIGRKWLEGILGRYKRIDERIIKRRYKKSVWNNKKKRKWF
jgi:hypothetical protein